MTQETRTSAAQELYEGLALSMLSDPEVTRSTMMGFPCLRIGGQFFACQHRENKHLVVKLPAARVAELVASGHGVAFAPSGRTFREWVELPEADAALWAQVMLEAREFVAGR